MTHSSNNSSRVFVDGVWLATTHRKLAQRAGLDPRRGRGVVEALQPLMRDCTNDRGPGACADWAYAMGIR
jgi:hypothetical protein